MNAVIRRLDGAEESAHERLVNKWGPGNAGLAEGVDGLMKRGPAKAPAAPDMYYFYYATQVVHFADGDDWKTWNEGPLMNGRRLGGMRDWLVALQDVKEGPNHGSWMPDGAIVGGSCGRLGTTAMSLLTLEVYYRHLFRCTNATTRPARSAA